jgi:hypothetical protein
MLCRLWRQRASRLCPLVTPTVDGFGGRPVRKRLMRRAERRADRDDVWQPFFLLEKSLWLLHKRFYKYNECAGRRSRSVDVATRGVAATGFEKFLTRRAERHTCADGVADEYVFLDMLR